MAKQSSAVRVVVRYEPDLQRMTKALLLVLLRPRQVNDLESREDGSQRKAVSNESEVG